MTVDTFTSKIIESLRNTKLKSNRPSITPRSSEHLLFSTEYLQMSPRNRDDAAKLYKNARRKTADILSGKSKVGFIIESLISLRFNNMLITK